MNLENLARQAASGDETALNELFEALEIKKYILRKYHLSREDTEDLTQEIKEMLYLTLPKFDEKIASYRVYASVIIKRAVRHKVDEVYDFNRHLSSGLKDELLDLTEEISLTYDETLDYLKKVLSEEEIEMVLYSISYGYSAKFISEKFHCSTKKVYKTIEKFKKVASKIV